MGDSAIKYPWPVRAEVWDRWLWIFAVVFAVMDFVSISIAQTAAAGMVICWTARHAAGRTLPDLSPLKRPIGAFVIVSLLAALFSVNVKESLIDSKDLSHFLIFFVMFDYLSRRREKIRPALLAVAAGGAIAAFMGLYQAAMRGIDIHNRISGFQDIYMTFAGLLMLAAVVATAIFIFNGAAWRGVALAGAAVMTAAIFLSLTRNAVMGLGAGLAVIIALRKPAWLVILPLLASAVFILSPSGVRNRVSSIADLGDETTRERFHLWSAGVKIILDHPVLGVGQNSFPLVYPSYRSAQVKEPNISHLHNNFLELGAERGLAGLGVWTWMWAAAFWLTLKGWKSPVERGLRAARAAGIGAITAFMAAGVFEYNFGASVIQMLMYYIVAAGLAASHEGNNSKDTVLA
ncbi:MAG: O-antigen ligase family protein [Nitrospinae bacterium]|nr:O-antigen ligase family protein [Nitrospinota bacterium]